MTGRSAYFLGVIDASLDIVLDDLEALKSKTLDPFDVDDIIERVERIQRRVEKIWQSERAADYYTAEESGNGEDRTV